MGRELRRVPLDFDWPLNKQWVGFLNPLYRATQCVACEGTGYSPQAKHLKDLWYGYVAFRPEDRGSVPHTPTDAHVRAFAERQCGNSPEYYYGTSEFSIRREAERLCRHWNKSWMHHLNDADVLALVKAGRLMDFTHTWSRETRWQRKEPPYIPSAVEVNRWSCGGLGHDSINSWVCIKAECKRLRVATTCKVCRGSGDIWPSREAKRAYDRWKPYSPPNGNGYQMWETTSEGSPISPVFSTPEDLARHLAATRQGTIDEGTLYETWLAFIRGPGWAPSMVMQNGHLDNGVVAVVENSR